MTDWYQVLEVPRQATEETIKKAYRRLVKIYHPDTHPGNQENEHRFREISEAYSILSDREKRKKYDEEIPDDKYTSKKSQRRKRTDTREAEPVNFSTMCRNFEQFFGFSPETKDIVNEDRLKPKEHNQPDVSVLFEQFMGIKK